MLYTALTHRIETGTKSNERYLYKQLIPVINHEMMHTNVCINFRQFSMKIPTMSWLYIYITAYKYNRIICVIIVKDSNKSKYDFDSADVVYAMKRICLRT